MSSDSHTRKIDWLLWGSATAIVALYLSWAVAPEAISNINWLSVLASRQHHLVGCCSGYPNDLFARARSPRICDVRTGDGNRYSRCDESHTGRCHVGFVQPRNLDGRRKTL